MIRTTRVSVSLPANNLIIGVEHKGNSIRCDDFFNQARVPLSSFVKNCVILHGEKLVKPQEKQLWDGDILKVEVLECDQYYIPLMKKNA